MKRILFIVLLFATATATATAAAQTFDAVSLRTGVDVGHNTTFGTFGNASAGLKLYYGHWSSSLEAAYSSSQITAVDLRQDYALKISHLSLSGRVLWRNLYGCNDLAAALYARYNSRYLQAELGWSGRLAGVVEPLNLYYSLACPLLRVGMGCVLVAASNHDDFVIERPHSLFLALTGIYSPNMNCVLSASAVLHQSGMMHLTAEYYEAYLKIKAVWTW